MRRGLQATATAGLISSCSRFRLLDLVLTVKARRIALRLDRRLVQARKPESFHTGECRNLDSSRTDKAAVEPAMLARNVPCADQRSIRRRIVGSVCIALLTDFCTVRPGKSVAVAAGSVCKSAFVDHDSSPVASLCIARWSDACIGYSRSSAASAALIHLTTRLSLTRRPFAAVALLVAASVDSEMERKYFAADVLSGKGGIARQDKPVASLIVDLLAIAVTVVARAPVAHREYTVAFRKTVDSLDMEPKANSLRSADSPVHRSKSFRKYQMDHSRNFHSKPANRFAAVWRCNPAQHTKHHSRMSASRVIRNPVD